MQKICCVFDFKRLIITASEIFMKRFFLIGIFAVLFASGWQSVAAQQNEPKINPKIEAAKSRQPVLVELYTAEGCPVCPTADRNLTFLETEQPFGEANLITLALHVDYWNARSFRDEFSSPLFSRRQEIYRQIFRAGSIYTPQMIVDGQTQFPGTDLAKMQKAIGESAKTEKGNIEIAADKNAGGDINLSVKISDLPLHETSTIFLAVAEDNLAPRRSNGDGTGRKRTFTSVVRQLKSLGSIDAGQKNSDLETLLQPSSDWKLENLKLVVFVQENKSRKILGVGKFTLTKT